MARFDGRVAFLTGAGRGIGAATAELLAAQGAAVAVADLDLEPAEEVAERVTKAGGKALALALDVTDGRAVDAAVQRAADELGGLDIVVALAGITRDNLLFRMSEDDWDAVITTHLRGSFLTAKAAQKHLVPRKYGKIVFLSSGGALGSRGQANYSTAKAGLQGLTKTLAIELGPFGINVNAVAPGFIETRMTRGTAERIGMTFEEYRDQAAKNIPLRRVGQPIDVANVIAFLASDEAAYVTGQVVYVAGGPRA